MFTGVPGHASTVDGFVTSVDSPMEFTVGSLHVVLDAKTHCATKRPFRPSSWVTTTSPVNCDSIQLATGSHLKLVGSKQGLTRFVTAQLTAYLANDSRTLERETLIEEMPTVSRNGQGWSGELWIDGYPMKVTPETRLLST